MSEMLRFWGLADDGSARPGTIEDLIELFETDAGNARRRVALDEGGGWRVSTVFLCVDHGHAPGDPPVLWETMVWNSAGEDVYQERYSGLREAREGHARAVAAFLGGAARAPVVASAEGKP